jgi:hypothetical protein
LALLVNVRRRGLPRSDEVPDRFMDRGQRPKPMSILPPETTAPGSPHRVDWS